MHTVMGIGKAIVAPVLSVNENDHLRLLGTTTFMCAFSVYASFSTASGDCRRSCMLFTRSSTRQVPISFPFDYHVAFDEVVTREFMFVRSSNVEH